MDLFVVGTFVSTSLSVLGSIFIIFVFLASKPTFSIFHFIFWLSVSDLGVYGTIFILNLMYATAPETETSNVIFYIIAMTSGVFGISTHLWNSSVALCFYMYDIFSTSFQQFLSSATPHRMWRFLLVNFGVPAIIVILVFIASFVTEAGRKQNIR
jgi:hypothetical protein